VQAVLIKEWIPPEGEYSKFLETLGLRRPLPGQIMKNQAIAPLAFSSILRAAAPKGRNHDKQALQ
jgi:hypothetical protein